MDIRRISRTFLFILLVFILLFQTQSLAYEVVGEDSVNNVREGNSLNKQNSIPLTVYVEDEDSMHNIGYVNITIEKVNGEKTYSTFSKGSYANFFIDEAGDYRIIVNDPYSEAKEVKNITIGGERSVTITFDPPPILIIKARTTKTGPRSAADPDSYQSLSNYTNSNIIIEGPNGKRNLNTDDTGTVILVDPTPGNYVIQLQTSSDTEIKHINLSEYSRSAVEIIAYNGPRKVDSIEISIEKNPAQLTATATGSGIEQLKFQYSTEFTDGWNTIHNQSCSDAQKCVISMYIDKNDDSEKYRAIAIAGEDVQRTNVINISNYITPSSTENGQDQNSSTTPSDLGDQEDGTPRSTAPDGTETTSPGVGKDIDWGRVIAELGGIVGILCIVFIVATAKYREGGDGGDDSDSEN